MKVLLFFLLLTLEAHGELPPVALAPQGCPMAHCNPQMNDQTKMAPPPAGAVLDFPRDAQGHQRNDGGSTVGLGCTSNGVDRFACAYANPGTYHPEGNDAVVVYDAAGNPVWKSGSRLNVFAAGSAPIIDAKGVVFAADSARLLRVDTRTGQTAEVLFPNHVLPISPVPAVAGHLFVAAKGLASPAPVMLVDTTRMTMAAAKLLKRSPTDAGFFETINTPSLRPDGKRAYVLSRYVDGAGNRLSEGRLIALDLNPTHADPNQRITEAWSFEFIAPSGASPTYIDGVIYFDGQDTVLGRTKTFVMAVKDNGSSGTLAWRRALPSNVQASFAQDPRGGIWVYPYGTPSLLRLDTSAGGRGRTLQSLNVDDLLRVSGVSCTSSAMTIHGDAENPVLIMGAADQKTLLVKQEIESNPEGTLADAIAIAQAYDAATYVAVFDLKPARGAVRALAKISDTALTLAPGQFAAIAHGGTTQVVFSTLGAGPYLLKAP